MKLNESIMKSLNESEEEREIVLEVVIGLDDKELYIGTESSSGEEYSFKDSEDASKYVADYIKDAIEGANKKDIVRYVSLEDGTSMDDKVMIFYTDAPVKKLKELEKEANQFYKDKRYNEEDPVLWSSILEKEGYFFEYIDEVPNRQDVKEWLKGKYPQVKEHYIIENQPE